jgi:hypothetical protein
MSKLPTPEAVIDDATRSVSVRLSVMDYGRIRTLAGQLKVRESVAFRLLMHAGLARMAGLYRSDAQPAELDTALEELARAAFREGLEAGRLARVLATAPQAQRAGLTPEALRERLEPPSLPADDAGFAGQPGEGAVR